MVFFTLFEATNFWARFWPALAGSFLVLAPFAFRYRLGQKAALIIALGLSLDPGMVALSRLAGGPMPAIAFTVLALALLIFRAICLGGIVAGLALLSGPAVFLGLLGLGIAYGIARLLGIFKNDEVICRIGLQPWSSSNSQAKLATVLFFGAGTVLLVGTFFFRYPQGLGALASTLGTFLQGWIQPSKIPAGRLLSAIFFYATLALIFGLVTGVRGWLKGHHTARFLSIWFLTASILPFYIQPGK